MWATSARKLSAERCGTKAGRTAVVAAAAAGALAALASAGGFVFVLVVLGAGAAEPDDFSSGRAFHIIFSLVVTQTDRRTEANRPRHSNLRNQAAFGTLYCLPGF